MPQEAPIQPAFEISRRLCENMDSVVLGKPETVRLLVASLLAGQHILLEDVPGVGKTLVAKSLALSIEGSFSRLQFTPDLLPSDILGSMIYKADSHTFDFSRGPIFANVVLADEINRSPPRTQSALLEAMSENCVSIDGRTHELPHPFIVVATQNPFEFEGTYALPESQLDRFLFRASIGYPERSIEQQVFDSHRDGEPVDQLKPVVSTEDIASAQAVVRSVRVEESVLGYLLDIVDATRQHEALRVGISTRGALSFYRGCQAVAVVEGRDFVTPDDVKGLAVAAFAHRVLPEGLFRGDSRENVETIISDLVQQIPVPI
ncbi:MAG: MoxR family ATPase [Planctomycetota bacterium]